LRSCVREEDTVARIGGDEFVVMLGGLGVREDEAVAHARAVGEKILDCLGKHYVLQGHVHVSTPSIGIRVFAGKGLQVDELIRQADLAMYEAKAAGRNTLRFFAPELPQRPH
ncbi:MAG TPA: diguanylate cyclase, partial [Thauera sp.]|nr:diguanylate cyclase [Thauera sp.]